MTSRLPSTLVLDLKVTLAIAYVPNFEFTLTLVLAKAILYLKVILPLSITATKCCCSHPYCLPL